MLQLNFTSIYCDGDWSISLGAILSHSLARTHNIHTLICTSIFIYTESKYEYNIFVFTIYVCIWSVW